MPQVPKRGSSRRKGDDYQDLIALRLALEHYIARNPFEMYLEFEHSGNLDDIVLFHGSHIAAYQVRYSVNPLGVYRIDDLTDPTSRAYLARFADSWARLRARAPQHSLTAHLCSNRSPDAALADLLTPSGAVKPTVIANRRRGTARQLRARLHAATGLDEDSFRKFLADFRFSLRQPPLADLEQHIRATLLDHKLGFSDSAVYFHLREAVFRHAVHSHDALTPESLDSLFEPSHGRLLVPQVFPLDRGTLVDRPTLSRRLDDILPRLDASYLVVTGLPGSGKSTALTAYFDTTRSDLYEVFRYYCFVGVHDNLQTLRVRANALHANLIAAFSRRYPDVITRRFDHSQTNFLDSLRAVADHIRKSQRKLILLLDGLDHVERLAPDLRDTVLSALPPTLPPGVVVIIGTQELHQWPHFLKQARASPDMHIRMPPFSESETFDYLVTKRAISGLSNADVLDLHNQSEGLPLHLRYTAEVLLASDCPSSAIASLSPANDGDIRQYYALLWQELDSVGSANARHLCAVMACLRFAVHRDELFSLVGDALTRPDFEDAYKLTRHLFRHFDNKLVVFHSSFSEFVFSQLPDDWLRQVRRNIGAFLRRERYSPRWFTHVFELAYDVGDYDYSCSEVGAEFVERALLRCRPSHEIRNAISIAIESARELRDFAHLSRLGILSATTEERLTHVLDRALLSKALLASGRYQDVIRFAYSPEGNGWVVDRSTALAILSALARAGHAKRGAPLFRVFMNEFREVDTEDETARSQILALAECFAIYSDHQAGPLRWLSRFSFTPDTLECTDNHAPGHAPHLAAYIAALVRFRRTHEWKRLRRIRRLFSNDLIHYLLIRALARHGPLAELHEVTAEYATRATTPPDLELAYYCAQAGLPLSTVSTTAGTLPAPPLDVPPHLSLSDPVLRDCGYAFVVMGYVDDTSALEYLGQLTDAPPTLWRAAVRYLLQVGHCLGRAFRGTDDDWHTDAIASVDTLLNAQRGEGERIFESIYLIRDAVCFALGELTVAICDRQPSRVKGWIAKLRALRGSLLWTTQVGIGESIEDYTFELALWERLAELPATRPGLRPILTDCASAYAASTLLKGGSRSAHFLQLAAIMARCGMHEEGERWLRYGVRASLIYGYHKDPTLGHLIDALVIANRHRPDLALPRCGRVLALVRWMPHLTDGRGTRGFTQRAFSAVLAVDRRAAIDLAARLVRTVAGWKSQDCLEQYICSAVDDDPEYLWCLSECFANRYSEDGTYARQMIAARRHIVDIARKTAPGTAPQLESRVRRFLLTELTPRHWPDDLKAEIAVPWSLVRESDDEDAHLTTSFQVEGQTLDRAALAARCRKSFSEFRRTLDTVEAENGRFYEPDFVTTLVRYHIAEAHSVADLDAIGEYLGSLEEWQGESAFADLGKRYSDLGRPDSAVTSFGAAYMRARAWDTATAGATHFRALVQLDPDRAESYLLERVCSSARGTTAEYCTPCVAVGGLDALGRAEAVDTIFEGFLDHCENLFSQLPDDDEYASLGEFAGDADDSTITMLDMCIEQLETSECDHGERMVRALTALAVARPERLVPMLVTTALSAGGRSQRRLLMILYCLVGRQDGALLAQQRQLAAFLQRGDYLCRTMAVRILGELGSAAPLEEAVEAAVQRTTWKYSRQLSHAGFGLSGAPSSAFSACLRKHTLFEFSDRLALLDAILEAPVGSCAGTIERRLVAAGWSNDEERSRVKEDWDEHVHPQGWPVVWVTTRFQETVTTVLWEVLDETVEKSALSEEQLRMLWLTMQTVDPECVGAGREARPSDISPLHVSNAESWLRELDQMDTLRVARRDGGNEELRWVTLFETRRLSQEEKYNVPYVQELSVDSGLVPRRLYVNSQAVDGLDRRTERILPSRVMSLTARQLRRWVQSRREPAPRVGEKWIPLVAVHHNPPSFVGYAALCSLRSFVVREFDLSFDGVDLTRRGETVARFEHWQEGYRDDAYSREVLSAGVRLRARRDFLSEVCQRYERLLCIWVSEKREHFDTKHDKTPKRKGESKRYVLHHLG